MLDDVMNIPTTLVCVCGGCVHVCLWDSWCAIHMWVMCVIVQLLTGSVGEIRHTVLPERLV